MKHGETYTFENGPHCKGRGAVFGEGHTGYTVDAVELKEDYPPKGEWSFNSQTAFDVFILKGAVTLAIRHAAGNIERIELDGTTETEEVLHTHHIPALTAYRWEDAGRESDDNWTHLTLIGNPAFSGDQYRVVSEEELRDTEDLLAATDPIEFAPQPN